MSGSAADASRDSIPESPSVTPTPTLQNEQAPNGDKSSRGPEPTGKDIMRPLETRDWAEIRAKHEALLREHTERVAGLDKKFDTFVNTIKAYLAVLHEQDIQKAKERFEARLNYVQDQEEEYEETREQGSKVLEEFERVFEMMSQFLETAKYQGA
ncbi:hypothetical protein BJ508DRAFT_413327 [Ascobolus immersus RN42]|uniref:Uncharacterized protein n=1 Tax=Ascobolus immersus RN42 TaxID=1160509 RepID=A0A3N4IC34_ASCIM|nr:hypothetical protein BJ508DRAFT_413327 [Ascobolus immersus RN42]